MTRLERVAVFVKEHRSDLLTVAGGLLVFAGLWAAWPPLALVAGGAGLVVVGVGSAK